MFQVQLHIRTIGPSFQDCCLEVRLAKIKCHSCLGVPPVAKHVGLCFGVSLFLHGCNFNLFLFREAFLSRSASYVRQSTCPDRSELLTHEQFVQRQQEHGHSIRNLFGCPGFRNTCIKHDWLHAADLGVAADVLGGTFQYIVDFYMEGARKKERCMSLFQEMQCFYREHNSQNRLPTLTPGMLTKEDKKSKKKSWPKIKAKAG